MSEIYLINADQSLVPLKQEAYATEDLLQALLAQYPSLLAGNQINPNAPCRWLLVKREAEVPGELDGSGRWSLDHLFLDQEGVPTLVEVKRSTDTRIRREVVGQMLDYAANGVKYWPVEKLRLHFEETCARAGEDPAMKLVELIGPDGDGEQFWITVKTNLQAGRIRMLFVADEIPSELQRIIEFLNEQMDPAEVLAVEIKQFAGGAVKTLVPRVIGQTAEAGERKRVGGTREKRQWDEASFFAEFQNKGSAEEIRVARRLLDWAQLNATRVWWGQGARTGSFIPVLEHGDRGHHVFALSHEVSRGTPALELYFHSEANKPPFSDRALRLEWLRRINEIPSVQFAEEFIVRKPSIPLKKLALPAALNRFIETLDWFVAEIENRTT